MLKKLFVVSAAVLMLGACDEAKPVAAPPPPPPAAAPTYMVFFDWDSATLNAQSQSTVGQAAAAAKSGGASRITATGYTDTSGAPDYNMALSLRRANAVKDALVRNGVPATAIAVVGRGEQDLLVQTGDGVREPQNRRVQIAIGSGMAGGMDDATYCGLLARSVRSLARGSDPQGDLGNALAQCQGGNPPYGIPVMEKYLTDNKVPLPSRG